MIRNVSMIPLISVILLCSPVFGSDSILVGVAAPITGDQGKMGTDIANGVKLAIEDWNLKGGVLGKKLEVVEGDDQHDPKQAVAVANKFINLGVVGSIGHFNSSCSIPASEILNDAGEITQITPASTNPLFTERGLSNTFRICGRDEQQGGTAALYVLKQMSAQRVAILHDKTTYGQGLADEFMKSLKSGGLEPVYFGGIVQGDKDFNSVLTMLKQKDPQVLFFGGVYPEAGLLTRQAKEQGMNITFISGDGTFDPEYLNIAGPAANGSLMTFTRDQRKIPEAQAIISRYESKFGTFGAYSIYAYSAADILIQAIQKTGSTDPKKINAELHKSEFRTAIGSIKFDSKGDVSESPFVIWQVQDGRFVQLEESKQ